MEKSLRDLMNYRQIILKISSFIPSIKGPGTKLNLVEKLKWTGLVLLLYFLLCQVPLFGLSADATDFLQSVRIIMAGSFGTLITLGIGPLVTSSIILQLLIGSKIIPLDLQDTDDRKVFTSAQRILAIAFTLIEGVAFVYVGGLPPEGGSNLFAGLLILQLLIGGFLIIFLDEIVTKWGLGSGISLFIVAGVSSAIIIQMFNPIAPLGMMPAGHLPAFIFSLSTMQPDFFQLLPIIFTVIVFLIVIYIQLMKVEVPLSFSSIRGFGRRWPLNFIYTSNISVIFAIALIMNIIMISNMVGLDQIGHYLSVPHDLLLNVLNGNIILDDLLRALCYTIFIVVFSVLFSIFWVSTADMDAKSVAKQIESIGMSIPGFRRDTRIVERVLNRYIPALTVLGGATVGLVAALADFTGALGGGMGILLTVMIVYQLYQEISTQHSDEMPPRMKKFFEK